MSWVKIDADFPNHPKMAGAGAEGGWLYVCGLIYCAKHKTNGFIPTEDVGELTTLSEPFIYAWRLKNMGLWFFTGTGFQVSDYLGCTTGGYESPLREAWNRMRKAVSPSVFERDSYRCTACGSHKNLTVDHVMPISHNGSNDLGNLQTLCRSCNSRKGNRMESLN